MRCRNGRLAKYLRKVPTSSRQISGQPLRHITKIARLSLLEPEPARFIPVTEASVQRCWAAGSARPELVAGQHGADGFDQLRLGHGALCLGLLLQMLLAALFQFGELGADDQILDR